MTEPTSNSHPLPPNSPLPTPHPQLPTAEESTRQWWQERFGSAMPEDVKTWLRTTIRREVQRARIEANRLDDHTLQRIREGRRLLQTKLSNVEEALQRTHRQQDRVQRFIELSTELSQQRHHLYDIGKQQASVLTEQRELERFETFEAINGRFQRIHTLTEGIAQARKLQGELAMRMDEQKKLCNDAARKLELERNEEREAQETWVQAARTMAEAERMAEQGRQQEARSADEEALRTALSARLELLRKELAENQAETERLSTETAALRLKRQSLEAHRQMIERGAAVQTMLDELLEAMNLRDRLSLELNQAMRRQGERDEQLGRLFNDHQSLQATIQARQEEVEGHRRSTAGQDSFTLQRRALELRSRKLMLETGFSLWRNIAAGYELIEQKNQLIASMRLRIDYLNRSIDGLQRDVRQLSQQLQQKTYHWTLSKSQNVIELRSDLAEGTPCTVCGATHHPWQSEGINEQSALISSLKADCESLERELHAKRGQLHEMQTELTATMGRLEAETSDLQQLLARQKQDTDEWQNFATLDRSFADCSPSTNREARTAMMQQLIEKTTVDAEEAEKELNAFTFHLDAISRLGTDIQRLQQQNSDLVVRLNEVNTACQVMAGQVERLGQRLRTANQNYSRRYEALEREISFPEWFRQWKEAPESIKLRIQDMMTLWQQLNTDINAHEQQQQSLEATAQALAQAIATTTSDVTQAEARQGQAKEQASKALDTLRKLLPDTDGKTHFQLAHQKAMEAKESRERSEGEYQQLLKEFLALQAQQRNLEEKTRLDEQRVADERRELDLWMQRYNANNPPVQFSELERVLADGKEWADVRKRVRSIAVAAEITQARVDNLRAQIIALQAEGVKPNVDDSEHEQQNLRRQQEELETQRRDILRQMAQADAQLRAHEQA